MGTNQYMAILAAIAFILILFFGFDTKAPSQKLIEKSRAANFENTSIDLLLGNALNNLSMDDRLYFEKRIQVFGIPDSASVDDLKEFSGEWYRKQQYAIAGYYAEKIALREDSEEAWSIAGTTYATGLQYYQDEKEKNFCGTRAVDALQKALSLNPENLSHEINLAICYADFPPQDNPMKGIQMLLELNGEHPENISVLMALGRFAIQTGQFDRARIRLEKVTELVPGNRQAYCLLSDVYQNLNETTLARNALDKCQSN